MLSGKAINVDAVSQAALKQLAKSPVMIGPDQVGWATQRVIVESLQEIDRLKATGKVDELKQKRGELFAEDVFMVTGAGVAIGRTKVVV